MSFLNALFPHKCHCSKVSALPVCNDCLDEMTLITLPCELCGKQTNLDGFCPSCKGKYEGVKTKSVYSYQCDKVREFVKHAKFSENIAALKYMGSRMADKIANDRNVVLIPVPLHINRLRERGFNQCLIFAEMIKKNRPKVNIDKFGVSRVRDTLHQARLKSSIDRANNIKDAFKCDSFYFGKKVIIIEDVITSGATMAELSKVIKGAASLECVVFARR